MQAISRIVAFTIISLLILPLLGADDRDKKADPPKEGNRKTDVKKDEPAKKDDSAKKDAKKDEPAKTDNNKKTPGKLPPLKGNLKGLETDKEAAEKKALRKATVTGTIVAVVEDKKSLRLRIPIPYVKIDQGQLQAYYNAQNLQQMLQAQARLYQLDKIEKEVELAAADEVKVRMKDPPPKFDDKGRARPYTRKELAELKGNDRLPGFPAEFSDLKPGQTVVVTLLQNKTGSRPIKRTKDAEGEAAADNLPKMSVIMIVADPKN